MRTIRWAGRSAPDGSPGTTVRSRSSRWRRRPACRSSRAGERDAARASSEGTGDVLRAVLDAGIRDVSLGIGGSATTDGGAGLLAALGATVSDDLTAVARGPRPAAGGDSAPDRVRRHQPAARRHVAPPRPTGRRRARRRPGPAPGRTPGPLRGRARHSHRSERARHGGRGCRRRGGLRAPARSPTGSRTSARARHRPRHGRDGLRRCARERGSRDHGRGPGRCADGVRQDGAGRGPAGAGGGNAVPRRRRRRDAEGIEALATVGASPCRSPRRRSRSRTRWPPDRRRSSGAASDSRGSCSCLTRHVEQPVTPARRATTATSRTTTKAKAKPKKAARRKADPVRHWANTCGAIGRGSSATCSTGSPRRMASRSGSRGSTPRAS